MKLTKNRAISIMICLLMLAQIVPSSWFSVPVFAYSPEPEEMANTKNDIDLPIDQFHVLSYVSAKPATCTDSGNKAYYVRSDCDKWFEDSLGTVEITDKSSVVIPASGHTPAEAVRENEVAAICCAAGSYDEVVYCSVCHEAVSREPKTIPIDEDAHDWGEWVQTKAPTETEPGEETRTCKNDPSHIETRGISVLGHTEVIDKAVEPTCTASGFTEGKHCSACGEVLVPQQTISALGHDFADEWTVDVEPTAESEGQKSRHCSRCDEVTDIIVIAKLVEIIDTSKKFIDVVESWSKPGIDYVVSYGYMNGTGNGTTFSPSGTMSRSMIVTVLYRIAGQPSHSGANPFTDINTGWYYDAVLWAYENGIVTGTSATTFAPDGAVTREQMATFLYRFANHMGYDTTNKADLTVFPDASKVGSWAYDALAWANAEGLIIGAVVGGETVLNPQGAATREQVATILMRFCKAFEE